MAEKYEYEYFNVTFPAEYVAHVEINRPEKMNAFIEKMWRNLSLIFRRLSYDPSVRAILLSGSGPKAFTAGLDVQAASQGLLSPSTADPSRTANALRRHILEFQSAITDIESCEKPVICILHGVSFGLALDMSLACDIRICSSNTKFSVKEVDIGLAADIGTLSRLPRAVSSFSWAKEICLTARIFQAAEALQYGLVSGVHASKEEAVAKGLEIAKTIAEKSPVATMSTKELLNWSRDKGVQEGLRYTAAWNMAMVQSSDVKAAIMSGLEKRKPKFAKL